MTGAAFSIDIAHEAGVRRMQAFLARVSRAEDLTDELGAALADSTIQRIEDERAPDGAAWTPWSERHAVRRAGGKMLQDNRDLLRSIGHEPDHAGVDLGANMVYAAIHQLGGTADMPPGPAAVPARPYLGVSAEDEETIGEILADWFARADRQAARKAAGKAVGKAGS